MNLTIPLDESQSTQLQSQAAARRLSAEQFAHELFVQALGKIVAEGRWEALNRRRTELIGKSRTTGLAPEEVRELEGLQAAVDQRLEPMDRQLLALAEQFRRQAEQLPDEPIP